MDQFRGSGEFPDGAPGGQGSLRDWVAASEVAGEAAGGRGPERRRKRNRTRSARISREVLRQLASARRLRVRGSDSTNERRQIQKDRAPRTVRWLAMEDVGGTVVAAPTRSGRFSATILLRPVTRVDAYVFRGEITGPITGRRAARVQVHNNVYMFFQQAIAGDAFVEIKRLAPAQDRDARHLYVHQVRIEFDAGAAGRGKDAAPVGIPAGKSGLDKGRSSNRLGNLPRGCFGLRAAHSDFDHPLRPFAIGHDLQRQRVANFLQRLCKGPMRA